MKKLALLILLATSVLMVRSQTQPKVVRYILNKSTIVKDSAGVIYSYDRWSKLVNSREYALRPDLSTGSTTPDFIIYKPSAAQLARMEALRNARQSQAQPSGTVPADGKTPAAQALTAAAPNEAIVRIPYKPAESEQFKTGNVFKPFKDKDINGVKLDLKQMAGKVLVINFWFIGCPPCRAEIPDLNEIAALYKDNKDVVFIAIALDEEYEIKQFLSYTPFNYHIIERGRFIAERYGVNLYPTNLIVDRQGKVAFSSVSNQSSNPYWMKRTINEALAASVNTTAAQ